MTARQAMILIVLLGPATAGPAQSVIIVNRVPPVEITQLELRQHQVNVGIEHQVATTRIEQVFYNPTSVRLEGTLLLPLPAQAAIERFSMDVDGKDTEAELLDAEKARKIYEDIVRQAKDPALLEYCNQQLLRARIFPIEPHSEKRITLRYSHLLRSDSGIVNYRYPITQRRVDGRAVGVLSMRVNLSTEHPLANVYCPSHDVEIKRHGEKRAVIGFESRSLPSGDFELYYSTQSADERVAVSLLCHRHGTDDGYFMLLTSPSAALENSKPQPKDIIFVLDTSGSMSQEKLTQAKRALRFCLANLNTDDRFEIIRFSTDVQPLFGELKPTNPAQIDQAKSFIDQLKPIGGTAIRDALLAALKTSAPESSSAQRPRFVVFLTDGKPTIGEVNEQEIVAQVSESSGITRVFCFGIGTEINTHLLDKITEATGAVSEYVLPQEDIEIKVSRFYTKIDRPVMTQLQLSIGTAPNARVAAPIQVSKMYPKDLPDLFSGEQLAIFGRYRGAGPALIRLTGTMAGKSEVLQFNGKFPDGADEHSFIPRLWAMRRVGFLLDEWRLRGESEEVREEITQLAREFGIVTPFTAYLIVEDEQQRSVPLGMQSLELIDRASLQRFETAMEAKSGEMAVRSAMTSGRLRDVVSAGMPGAERNFVFGVGGKEERTRAPQLRFINGRTFVYDGSQWKDTRLGQLKHFEPVRIVFNSDEYFELLHRHPKIAKWLSVGRNIQLVVDDQAYQVVEGSE